MTPGLLSVIYYRVEKTENLTEIFDLSKEKADKLDEMERNYNTVQMRFKEESE